MVVPIDVFAYPPAPCWHRRRLSGSRYRFLRSKSNLSSSLTLRLILSTTPFSKPAVGGGEAVISGGQSKNAVVAGSHPSRRYGYSGGRLDDGQGRIGKDATRGVTDITGDRSSHICPQLQSTEHHGLNRDKGNGQPVSQRKGQRIASSALGELAFLTSQNHRSLGPAGARCAYDYFVKFHKDV